MTSVTVAHDLQVPMIRSLLVSGYLNGPRLARVLGEIVDIGAAARPGEKLVIVFESEGGSLTDLLAFLECVLEDEPARTLIEQAEVKIYEAYSAAALLAFWMGSHREMAAGTRIGFHLPLLKLQFWEVDLEGRRIDARLVKQCREYEVLLARLMRRHGLDEPELNAQLYNTGWLYMSAKECLRRRLVHGIF